MQQTKRTKHDTRLAEKHLASDIGEVREHAQDINRDSNEALQEVNPDHDSSPGLEAQDPNSRTRGRNSPAEYEDENYQHFTSMMDYEEEAARLDQNANEHTPSTDAEIEEDLSEVVAPAMSQCCVIKMATQDTSAVIDAIHETLASPPPRQTHDSPYAENHNDNAPLRMQREGEPLNDYTGGPELLYKTWAPLMPLRRGFQPGKVIPESRWRQVFMFHDNRFSHNRTMLYHVANTLMRHAVNKAVSVTMRTNANAFEKLQLLINSPDFMSKLRAAKANPKGEEVSEVLRQVMNFLTVSGARVPWGRQERKDEITRLYAMFRNAGGAMFFYTYAPDDVHDMRVIRLAPPYTDQHSFPAIVPDKYKKALAGATDTERVVRSEDGSIEFDFRERALQSLAARNPCACAVVFNHISENVRDNLLGKSRHRLKDTALSTREKGILGRCVSNHDVIETNKRVSMRTTMGSSKAASHQRRSRTWLITPGCVSSP